MPTGLLTGSMGEMRLTYARLEVHAKERSRNNAGCQSKRGDCHAQVDANDAVTRRGQVHAAHLPEHLQVLAHLLQHFP